MIPARTVAFTVHAGDVLVEHTDVPAFPWLGPEDVAAAHLIDLSQHEPGVEPGDIEYDGDGLRRRFALSDGGRAIARYLPAGDQLLRLTARGAAAVTDAQLLAAIDERLDADAVVELSTLEARVVEGLLGVEHVRFIGAAWWSDVDDTHRSLLAEQLRAGLAARALLIPGDEPVSDRLRRAVTPILDADLIALATRRDEKESRMIATGVTGTQWSVLAANSPARLEFLPVSDAASVPARLMTLLGVTDGAGAHADEPGALRTLWHVSLVRKAPGGLESTALSWCADDAGALWRIDGPAAASAQASEHASVTASSAGVLERELGELLGLAGTTVKEQVR